MCVPEEPRVNGSANKVNGNANGFVRASSEQCSTVLDDMQMRTVQPPDVVTSQRRRNRVVSTIDDDSLEVSPDGVDNPGYAEDSSGEVLGPGQHRQYDGWVTPTIGNGNATRREPTRLQYVSPRTQNPLRGFMADGRRSATPSSSVLPRNSPVQRPTSAPGGGGRRSAPLRSTPLSGLDNVYEEEPITEAPTMMVRGRVVTPTVGLTVEEVDRITDSRRCTPAAAAAAASHSSTTSTGRGSSPDLVNRTDFTRDDLELVARPHSTTSDDDDDDDTRDETFTCSEYDSGGRRRAALQPMLDFANPYRLRMAPSLALPPPPPQPLPGARRSVTPRDRVTPRDGGPSSSSGSTADEMFSVDDRRHAPPAGLDGSVDLSRTAAELGWTPNFDVLAEVFFDIAALSDAGRSTAVAAGRSPVASPVRSTPQPLTTHRPTGSASARSGTPASRTRSPMNNVDVQRSTPVDRVHPLQRLASPAERLGVADGHRSSTPSSQAPRHTPLDGVHRRNPSSPTSPPPYVPPSRAYDGRGLNRTASPGDRLASPAPGGVPRQRDPGPSSPSFYSGDATRGVSPRGKPVLEEYV